MTLSITTLCIWVPLWWVSFCWVSHFIYCYAECHYVDVILLNVLGPSLSLANLSSLAYLPVRPEPTRVKYLSSAPLYCRLLTLFINIRLAWKGPTTFSITTLSITTLSITICHYVITLSVAFYLLLAECHYVVCHYDKCRYAECSGAHGKACKGQTL